MKNIRSYKLFEKRWHKSNLDIVEIIETIRDILIELDDDGYNIEIVDYLEGGSFLRPYDVKKIKVIIKKGLKIPISNSLTESILRVYQYMREIGFYSNMYIQKSLGTRVIMKPYLRSDSIKTVVIRPDDRIVTNDKIFIDEGHPDIHSFTMEFRDVY